MSDLIKFNQPNVNIETLKTGEYTANIRMGAGESKPVKQGVITQGDFFLNDPNPLLAIPLGREVPTPGSARKVGCGFRALLGPYRPHALSLINNTTEKESFNMDDPVFKELRGRAPGTEGNPVLVGVDVLYYLPPTEINWDKFRATLMLRGLSEADAAGIMAKYTQGFVGIYFYNKTSTKYVPVGTYPAGSWLQVSSHLIETKKHSWFVPGGHMPIDPVEEWQSVGVRMLNDEIPRFIAATQPNWVDDTQQDQRANARPVR